MITGIVLNNRKYLPTNIDDVGEHFFMYCGFFVWEEKQKITKTILVWPVVLHRGINSFFTSLWPQSNEGKDIFFNFTLQ